MDEDIQNRINILQVFWRDGHRFLKISEDKKVQ